MKPTKDTIFNLVSFFGWGLFGIATLVIYFLFGGWHHLFVAAVCFVFVRIAWTDDSYGAESMKQYYHRVKAYYRNK